MKIFTEKKIWQKFIIVLTVFILLFQFAMPVKSYALDIFEDVDWKELGNNIAIAMAQILAGGGDLVMGALNKFMLGTAGFGTAMISSEALGNESWFNKDADGNNISITQQSPYGDSESDDMDNISIDSSGDDVIIYVKPGTMAEGAVFSGSDYWEIPNLLYCPENIFGNNIAMLDVNFLNPNGFISVVESGRGKDTADEKSQSIAGELKDTISSWYLAFRNIAVVALLSILVYLGIRILISSTAEDKAKYKETIRDWIIALVLVFVMHFIMSATIMIVNRVNVLFNDINRSVYISYNNEIFRSNFTGVMRFLAQSTDGWDAWAYTIIYLVLVVYTVSFTIQYLRRLLYIAFYTMISPLVAITYPIDKLGDGKSQAFNKWFKEYVMTMVLQPIHLIIYSMIVSSALTLAIQSPLYAIVAIGFLIPAEQFIKSLFGVESKADGGFGNFAAGALAMNAMNKMAKPMSIGAGAKNSGGGKSSGSDNSSEEKPKVREANNKELASLRDGNEDSGERSKTLPEDSPLRNAGSAATALGAGAAGLGMSANNKDSDNEEKSQSSLDRGNNNPPLDTSDEQPSEDKGSQVGRLIRDTYNNSEFKMKRDAKKKRIQGVKDLNKFRKQEASEQKQKEKDKQRQIKLQKAQQKQIRLKSAKDLKKFNKQESRDQWANKHKKLSSAGRFTRKLGGAVASDIGRGISGAAEKWKAGAPKRQIKKAIRKKYAGKRLKAAGRIGGRIIKGGFGATKFVARNGLKIAGSALGAGVGIATGIASGKGLEGAMQGAGAGFVAGGAVGKNVYNLAEGAVGTVTGAASYVAGGVKNTVNDVKDIYTIHKEAEMDKREAEDAMFGTNTAQEYGREHITKAEKKRYDQILNEYMIQNGEDLEKVSGKSKKELYKDIYDYESHKVYDQDKIIRGLAIEHSNNYADLRKEAGFEGNSKKHENVVDIMQMTNSFGKSYTTDEKKKAEFDRTLDVDNVRSKKDAVKKVFYAAVGSDWKQAGNDSKKTTK